MKKYIGFCFGYFALMAWTVLSALDSRWYSTYYTREDANLDAIQGLSAMFFSISLIIAG